MPRTHEDRVRAVINTALTSSQVGAFVEDASLWVTEELSAEGYTEARLEVIERYLACALIRVRDLGLSSVTFKEAAEKYQVDPEVTDYLVRAASFDSSGKIRRHFLSGGDSTSRPVRFQVGTGFRDEQPEVTS